MKKDINNGKGYKLKEVIVIIIVTSIISAVTTGIIFFNKFRTDNGMAYDQILQDNNIMVSRNY